MLSLFINWDISPEIFNLGGISIRYYGLLFAVVLGLLSLFPADTWAVWNPRTSANCNSCQLQSHISS